MPMKSEREAALLDKRGVHKYSLAAESHMDAIANDTGAVNVENIKNIGALADYWRDEWSKLPAIAKTAQSP